MPKKKKKEESTSTKQFREWLVTSFDKNEEQIKRILVILCVTRYAYILHDNDTYSKEDIERLGGKDGKGKEIKEGDKKDPHWHIYFHTKGKYTPTKMAVIWEEPSHHVDCVKLPNKTLRYLVHTEEFQPKTPYPVKSVKTNIKDFEDIVNATLDEFGETTNDYMEILSIIDSVGFYTYKSLVDYLVVFRPSLVKSCIEKCYAFQLYIKQSGTDYEKERLNARVIDLEHRCRYLLSRLEEYEGKVELPESLFPKYDPFTGEKRKTAI